MAKTAGWISLFRRSAIAWTRRSVFAVSRATSRTKRFEEALRDSEERYRLLFESTPQPIWVYNEDTLAFSQSTKQRRGFTATAATSFFR